MTKKVIAVDIDDVLAESARNLVEYSNKSWGTNITVDDYDEDWAKLWQVDYKFIVKKYNPSKKRKANLFMKFIPTEPKFKSVVAIVATAPPF